MNTKLHNKFVKISAIIFSCLILISCSIQENRLKESGYNTKFDFDQNKSFNEYIKYSKDIISLVRNDNSVDNEAIINDNSPFLYRRDIERCNKYPKRSILMIHGLTDSPFINRELATAFNQKCFDIYSILLTGHGTQAGDLLSVSYKDWIKQVDYAMNEILEENEEVFISGFSTGGALAINYALEGNNYKNISGLILLSPAIDLSNFAFITPFLKYFKKYLEIYDDDAQFKYESFTTNAAAQIYHLTTKIKKNIYKNKSKLQNIPIFTAISYEDTTIDAPNSLDIILDNVNLDNSFTILYHQNESKINKYRNVKNLKLVNSTILNKKILNISHLAIPVSKDNYYYGKNGLYQICTHYYNDKKKYQKCLSSKDNEIFKGEISSNNMDKFTLRRIGYNPFWDNMVQDIKEFILSK
jgi:esterase/lipase